MNRLKQNLNIIYLFTDFPFSADSLWFDENKVRWSKLKEFLVLQERCPRDINYFHCKSYFPTNNTFSSYLYCRWCTATYMQQNLCFKMQNSLSSSWNIIADFITRITERIKDHMNWKIKYLGISWLPDILCTFNEIGFWLMAAWPFAFPVFLLPSKK